MAERTQRGKKERKTEDGVVGGEPTTAHPTGRGVATGVNATRDQGTSPADDDASQPEQDESGKTAAPKSKGKKK